MRVPDIVQHPGICHDCGLTASGIRDATATVLEWVQAAVATPLGQWSAAFTATVLVACVVWERVERGRAGPADSADPAGRSAWFWDGLSARPS
jgi:hypothetical protein